MITIIFKNIFQPSDESIKQAAAIISRGGLVAFPTETVYGLGGDAFNPAALARIFEAKNRPRFDPLIVHIAAIESLEKVADLSLLGTLERKNLAALTEQFWPGPFTLILPKQKAIPDLATSGLPNVAVRFPAHDVARKLITLSSGAVAAPSANPFGYLSPTRAEHVVDALGEKVDMILDGGPTQFGLESTVLDICQDTPRILRPGGVPREAIEALIGKVIGYTDDLAAGPVNASLAESADTAQASPGLLKSHYAPRAQLMTHNNIESLCGETGNDMAAFEPAALEPTAWVFFDGTSRDKWLSRQAGLPEHQTIAVLSETGNMLEAAARLFDILHSLDQPDIKRIHAQLAPEESLGVAINDRLRRAAAKKEISRRPLTEAQSSQSTQS